MRLSWWTKTKEAMGRKAVAGGLAVTAVTGVSAPHTAPDAGEKAGLAVATARPAPGVARHDSAQKAPRKGKGEIPEPPDRGEEKERENRAMRRERDRLAKGNGRGRDAWARRQLAKRARNTGTRERRPGRLRRPKRALAKRDRRSRQTIIPALSSPRWAIADRTQRRAGAAARDVGSRGQGASRQDLKRDFGGRGKDTGGREPARDFHGWRRGAIDKSPRK